MHTGTYLNISRRGITSLKDYFITHPCPNLTELDCSNNKLKNLKGCPKNLTRLNCSYNELTSLKGCPQSVIEFYCANNNLTLLEGYPLNVDERHSHCWGNPLSVEYKNIWTLDGIKMLHLKKIFSKDNIYYSSIHFIDRLTVIPTNASNSLAKKINDRMEKSTTLFTLLL